jgi:hypothetical protein
MYVDVQHIFQAGAPLMVQIEIDRRHLKLRGEGSWTRD